MENKPEIPLITGGNTAWKFFPSGGQKFTHNPFDKKQLVLKTLSDHVKAKSLPNGRATQQNGVVNNFESQFEESLKAFTAESKTVHPQNGLKETEAKPSNTTPSNKLDLDDEIVPGLETSEEFLNLPQTPEDHDDDALLDKSDTPAQVVQAPIGDLINSEKEDIKSEYTSTISTEESSNSRICASPANVICDSNHKIPNKNPKAVDEKTHIAQISSVKNKTSSQETGHDRLSISEMISQIRKKGEPKQDFKFSRMEAYVHACRTGRLRYVVVQIYKGFFSVDDELNHGWTALMHSAFAAQLDLVRLFLTLGANPSYARREDNMTVLMALACFPAEENDEVVECGKELIRAGADIKEIHSLGYTAVEMAEQHHNYHLQELLLHWTEIFGSK